MQRMKLLVATDEHLFRSHDGQYWSKAVSGYHFWTRYLNVFDDVRVVARVKDIEVVNEDFLRVDGPHVEVFGIPFFQGPKQLLKKYFKIQGILRKFDTGCCAAIFRLPSQTAYMAYQHWDKRKPFAGEIVYDPSDSIKKGMSSGVIPYLLDYIIGRRLKKFCTKANGVAYVTRDSIQKHYPSKARIFGHSDMYFENYYSSITMGPEAFGGPRMFKDKKSFTVAMINAAMNSERKGERVFLQIIKKAFDAGIDIYGIIIGDGIKRIEYEEYSRELNISDRIRFTGMLSTALQVRQLLDETDIFILPTQGEGLPRSILESMALGLPVLSTEVGGIPEIINDKYLFDPYDIDGFTKMLIHLIASPEELEEMSKRNYCIAMEYRNEVLQLKRDDFYRNLLNLAHHGYYPDLAQLGKL